MNQLIAFCGLDCAKCEAYLATQANDQAAQERVLAKWRQEFNAPNMTLADVTCDGCLSLQWPTGRLLRSVPDPRVRCRAQGANCAYCADYAGVRKAGGLFCPGAGCQDDVGRNPAHLCNLGQTDAIYRRASRACRSVSGMPRRSISRLAPLERIHHESSIPIVCHFCARHPRLSPILRGLARSKSIDGSWPECGVRWRLCPLAG